MILAGKAGVFDEKEWKILVEELSLSPQQGQIVHHLFTGESDKQIAQEMGLAVPTVRTHMGRLFTKFNVQDRVGLIIHIFHHFRNVSKLNISPPRDISESRTRLSDDINGSDSFEIK
ncbi:MAG: helix-turn-helix transcriptional regulator [Sedimentisphaerales bacterium]